MEVAKLRQILDELPSDTTVQVSANDPCMDAKVGFVFYNDKEALVTLTDDFCTIASECEVQLWPPVETPAPAQPAQPQS